MISSRHENELQAAAREIRSGSQARVEYVVADMTQRSEADRLAQAAIEAMSRVDILVNNAGSNLPQPIDQIQDDDWDRLIELNLGSCMALCRAVVPFMKERRWGRNIHISSIMGSSARPAVATPARPPRAASWAWPGPAPTTWAFSASGRLHRPRTVPHRPAQGPALPGKAG